MGIDLTLVVDSYGIDPPLAYERLRMDRNYNLFESIKEAGIVPLREGRELWWYDDEGIEYRTTDAYDTPLTSTRAKLIADAMSKQELTPKNRAVAKYMEALPPDTEIFLWWH